MDQSRRITSDVHFTNKVDLTCLSVSGKSDVWTDGQSVRAETAAVNMKEDAQRTAAGIQQCDLYVTKTVSVPNGADVPASCNISSLQPKLVLTCLNA